jgi:phosphoglycolate phosphatase-like HAD superfamily hydrolase
MIKCDVKPGQAIYFGDAKSDYKAAKENKISFVGIVRDKNSELCRLSFKPRLKDFISHKK